MEPPPARLDQAQGAQSRQAYETQGIAGSATIGTRPLLRALHGSDADIAQFERVGAMIFESNQQLADDRANHVVSLPLPTKANIDITVSRPTEKLRTRHVSFPLAWATTTEVPIEGPLPTMFITEAVARAQGLEIVESGSFGVGQHDFSESQLVAIGEVSQDLMFDQQVGQLAGHQPNTWPSLYADTNVNRGLTRAQVLEFIGLIALILVLLIVAIALSLAAAEGRDERDVLVAIGARPPTMRNVAAFKAATLAVGGALLAIPIGFLPIASVLKAGHSLQQRGQALRFPWQLTVGLVVVIPAIAAIVAWLGSWIAQTARPTRMSTLAND